MAVDLRNGVLEVYQGPSVDLYNFQTLNRTIDRLVFDIYCAVLYCIIL